MGAITKENKPKRLVIGSKTIFLVLIVLSGILCFAFFALAFRITTNLNVTISQPEIHSDSEIQNTQYAHDSEELLPSWMKEYFQWHKEQRYLLNQAEHDVQAISSMKFLLMECWPWNPVCGGTADRLRSIPFMVLVAHQTQRVLLIHWGRPAPLEEFLLPPQGGLDWRVPSWLIPRLANQSNFHAATRVDKLVKIASWKNETVITTRLQSHDHGAEYYNSHRTNEHEPMLRDVYRYVWQKIFTPTAPITKLIREQLDTLGLVPGEYAAAHLRALYLEVDRKPEQLQRFTENAVNCASMLRPGGPVYFASDSIEATEMAIAYGNTKGSNAVVARKSIRQPLHLDKTNDTSTAHSDLYDTFVDLYLLGLSRCLTYNIGGYGKWGLMMGYNSSCGMRHQKGYGFKKDGLANCHWKPAAGNHGVGSNGGLPKRNVELPLLPPPVG